MKNNQKLFQELAAQSVLSADYFFQSRNCKREIYVKSELCAYIEIMANVRTEWVCFK